MSESSFVIVGALNVTPDSFYDGGAYASADQAIARADAMIAEGADIIDIGGESTFVDRADISADEELARILPVIAGIHERHPDVRISIDTSKAAVAQASVVAGATMINDVTAGRGDQAMFPFLATVEVPVVLMYAKDPTSRTTKDVVRYDDVIATIGDFLAERKRIAVGAGIAEHRIILDPGLGFFVSGDPRYSFEILARLGELRSLGSPLYVSPSRKSFLAGAENLPPAERLPGTIAASAIAVLNGAAYIRTHDVAEIRRGCEAAMGVLIRLRTINNHL